METCPKCGYESDSEFGVTVHWGRMHDGECPVSADGYNSGEDNPFYGETFEHSESAKQKIGEASKQRWSNEKYKSHVSEAISSTLDGHEVTEETREKIRRNTQRKTGSNNPMWKEDNGQYPDEWTSVLREFIRQLHDNHCYCCNYQPKMKLDVHHVDGDKQNCDWMNLIPLCRSCHTKITIRQRLYTGAL